jgi:oligopeptide transport system substrate-binding protein
MFTNPPTLAYLYNTSDGHKAIGEYIQAALAGVGINMNLVNQEWNTFLDTRKEDNYDVARNGWLADYNDPISFLDMWITSSGNNDCQFGKGAHASFAGYDGKTWADSYDKIIGEVKTSTDATKRFELMHDAEDILMETGAICPIYYYTDIFMCSESIDGFFASPLGYKYFMYASIK